MLWLLTASSALRLAPLAATGVPRVAAVMVAGPRGEAAGATLSPTLRRLCRGGGC